jgi:hypothetical protein
MNKLSVYFLPLVLIMALSLFVNNASQDQYRIENSKHAGGFLYYPYS